MNPSHTVVKSQARELIAAGWIQHSNASGDGKFCIVGALASAAGAIDGDETRLQGAARESFNAALAAIDRLLPADWCTSFPPGPRLAAWNDCRGRRSMAMEFQTGTLLVFALKPTQLPQKWTAR